MARHSDKAREELLDAAEELFARHGIDAVSNRKITEHAGTANHSAIRYHFGSREDLLRALVERVIVGAQEYRQSSFGPEDLEGGLREIVTQRILPWVHHLGTLQRPSYRAQFMYQARSSPVLSSVVAGLLREDVLQMDLRERSGHEVAGIPAEVLRARSGILGSVTSGICAHHERMVNEGKEMPNWDNLGYFLVDAIVGMLSAPSTVPADFLLSPNGPAA